MPLFPPEIAPPEIASPEAARVRWFKRPFAALLAAAAVVTAAVAALSPGTGQHLADAVERDRNAAATSGVAGADGIAVDLDDEVTHLAFDPGAEPEGAGAGAAAGEQRSDAAAASAGPALPESAPGQSEIDITVPVANSPEGRDGGGGISAEAALACAAVERAIEANRIGDTSVVETSVYEAFPYATSAPEGEIARLGADLLDALMEPTLPSTLNSFLNACVASGHGV